MKVVEITKATASLARYAREVAAEPVVVTARGRPVAALVSIGDEDLESTSLARNPQFLAILERSWRRLRAEGGLSTAQMRRRLGMKKRV